MVLDALREAGELSRGELAERTGLSRSAVWNVVAALHREGLVAVTTGRPEGRQNPAAGRGRPSARIRLADATGVVLGIDVGNSHVRCAIGTVDGRPLQQGNALRDPGLTPARALDLAANLAAETLAAARVTSQDVIVGVVGVPTPVIGPRGRIAHNNILPEWVGTDPATELGTRLGITIQAENDANLGAVGEGVHGAGRGHDALLYVKVATGIGAGILVDGELVRGSLGMAGEIGHVQIDPGGQVCRCGARGCLETLVSSNRLLDTLRPVLDGDLDIGGFRRLLLERHPNAVRITADAGRTIGRVLADSCTLLNPSRIVIGGPLQEGNALIAAAVAEAVATFAHPAAADATSVVAGELNGTAEVLGALCRAGRLARHPGMSALTNG